MNASGYNNGPKANRVGNPIDVSMLEVLISLFGGARAGKPGHNSEKAKDMRGPVKTGGENAGAQHEKDVRNAEKQDAREQKLLREKELNTLVWVRISSPDFKFGNEVKQDKYLRILKDVTENPEETYVATKTFPTNKMGPFFSKEECNAKFSAEKILKNGSGQ